MNLYSPKFERSLRRGARKAIRISPELKREYKRGGRTSRSKPIALTILVAVMSVPAILPFRLASETRDASTGIALLGIIDLFAAFFAARVLLSQLYAARDLGPLFMLPIDESAIFRWKLEQFILKSQTLVLLLLLGSLAGIGVALHFSSMQYLAIVPIGLLAWLAHLALVVHCAARLPRRAYRFSTLGGVLGGVALFFLWKFADRSWVIMLFEQSARALNLCLPPGWSLSLFKLLLPQPQWFTFAFLLPIGVLIFTVPLSLRLLRRNFGFKEGNRINVPHLAPDLIPGVDFPRHAPRSARASNHPHLGETAIADIILSGQYLTPPTWPSRGPLERWFWRLLDERERSLADLAFPSGVALSASWRSICRTAFVIIAAGLAAGLFSHALEYSILGVGVAVVGILVLGTFLGAGRTFQPVQCGGVKIPLYAAFPVEFSELSRFLWKFSLAQFVPLLAFTLGGSFIVVHLAHAPFIMGLQWAGKVALLILAYRFISITFRFSRCTNDISGFRFHAIVIFCGAAVLITAFFVSAIFALVLTSWAGWLLCVVAALDAFALHRFYRWFYHKSCFDVMSLPRQ